MNLIEAMILLEKNGYNIDSWKDDVKFRKYLVKNNIDIHKTPDNLLQKHYDIFIKLNEIDSDFKR